MIKFNKYECKLLIITSRNIKSSFYGGWVQVQPSFVLKSLSDEGYY
jgi:hypothetical protein